ncbi:uncharacterized protein BXIN_1601 [Babesia sp. Xinjiang]|uniref:uncharacterized protein n=1 Tax=Babesia sp. Xinjiang TaxID=462227 RepID=UPI000A2356B8|nr:uncharacterized protein BXIN_1601 [Babesia sp. Xinjiang]ORM39884.1 hypothetical protein BXIN_1601 [Babesia sp. Xinjiang]
MSLSAEEHIRYLWKNVNHCKVVILMTEKVCECNGNGQHNKLTCPPGNLKECIDWILRVTNKDGQNGGDCKKLGEEVKKLLEQVKDAATGKLNKDKNVLTEVISKLNSNSLISTLADNLKKFIGYNDGGTIGNDGIGNKGNGNGTKYTSSYKDDANWNATCNKNDQQQCASIFLGTIPVIFSGLTYLYWQCNTGSRWSNETQINSTNAGIGIYFASCGYNTSHLSDKKANDIKSLLGTNGNSNGFKEFKEASTQDLKDYNKQAVGPDGAKQDTKIIESTYSIFIQYITDTNGNGLLNNVGNSNKTSPDTHPLSSLYLASQYYFQSTFNNGDKQPTTIREMLYWLMALPYSPCFQLAPATIKQGITKHGSDIIPFEEGPTLTTNDPHSCYLSTSCNYAAVVLSTMQGTLITKDMTKNNTTPQSPTNLHDIYSNSHFQFNYPHTVIDWFNELWNVVYHLLSQLYFLNTQCLNCPYNGGWQCCKYGNGSQLPKENEPISWFCVDGAINTGHAGKKCNTHGVNCATNHKECGLPSTKPSPLQAFLTDCLTGFQCESLENDKCHIRNGQLVSKNGVTPVPYSDHISHRNFNQYCPVPMGFNKDCLSQSPRTGNYIHWILDYFTQDDRNSVSLYNIIICLICCSLRTPRTVGDLFAFFLYLGGIMNNGSSPNVADAIQKESNNFPNKPNTESTNLTSAVQTLAGEYHTDESHKTDDPPHHTATLHSLYNSECTTPQTCGQYLDPLSFVIYPIISESFAKSYLSRIIYLTQALKDGLEVLLTEFNNLTCENCKNCGSKPKHKDGCHGKENNCHCPTIVQCHNVLPLFIKFGFTYYSAAELNDTGDEGEQQRQCKAFSEQLDAVVTGKPFTNLLKQINLFLYDIRYPFLYYLLTFWLIALLYLLYTLLGPLDILHMLSHWRLAYTHHLLPLHLLAHNIPAPTTLYFTT